MNRLLISTAALALSCISQAQNTGIGITTPRAKLHVYGGASGNTTPFSPLVVESNTNTYINLLSPDANETSILFGKASDAASGGITYNSANTSNGLQFRTNGNLTRMLIRNNGDVGIAIGEGIPGATLDVNRGSNFGGTAIFRGTNHTSNFNFSTNEDTYIRAGKNNGSVVLNDIPGGKVGIGTASPNAPLGFPAALGKKITLYPGGTGDVGFAVQGNLLQIYTDHPNADIAFGYDQGGVFTERFRMRANGAFMVNGNVGSPGQVLQTNGDGAVPTWSSATNLLYSNTILLQSSSQISVTSNSSVSLPGLNYSFTATSNTKVLITFSIAATPGFCIGCGITDVVLDVNLDGMLAKRFWQDVANGTDHLLGGTALLTMSPGPHTISFSTHRFGPDVYVGNTFLASHAILQIIPQ